MPDTTFFIDVWGTYHRQILSPEWITQIARNCGCDFQRTVVLQNNIEIGYEDECAKLTSERLNDESISAAIRTDQHAGCALGRWGLSASDFSPIPYQSMADLVAIDQCATEYIVFFSGDSAPWGSSNWVNEGIALLNTHPDIMVVNPTWNGFYHHLRVESVNETPTYFLGQAFSDQCYLARTADLQADIYRETNADADRIYCPAHGNTFEKRVSAYMRNHDKLRATLKTAAYITRP